MILTFLKKMIFKQISWFPSGHMAECWRHPQGLTINFTTENKIDHSASWNIFDSP